MARTGRPRKKIDMAKCVQLRNLGWTQRDIARLFGVNHSTISRRLRTWIPPRSRFQEVIVRYHDRYTQFIVVGKKIHTLYKAA